MRSDHLSKHLKTHVSNKRCGSNTQQSSNCGDPSVVTMSQESIKLESNMIANMSMQSQEDHDKKGNSMNTGLGVVGN